MPSYCNTRRTLHLIVCVANTPSLPQLPPQSSPRCISRLHIPRSLVQIRQSLPDVNLVLLEQLASLTEVFLLQLQQPQPSLILNLRVLLLMLPKLGYSLFHLCQLIPGISHTMYR
jgi:hypothetical protein